MQVEDKKTYRVSPYRVRTFALGGGVLGHRHAGGRRLWIGRFIGGALLPKLDYSLWLIYKQMHFHMSMGSRRGTRYLACLPVHGQRTRTNSRTARRAINAILSRF